MPTSGFGLYHMQNAKNNFDALRPAPVCAETSQFIGQCQNIHVSTNCYYGYHGAKHTAPNGHAGHNEVDCEMPEMPYPSNMNEKTSTQSNARKRSADIETYPRNKRLKEEYTHESFSNKVQRKRNIEPETKENLVLDSNAQDLLENLYWHIHGGNIFHLLNDSLQ